MWELRARICLAEPPKGRLMNEHLQAVEQIKSTVIDLAIKFGPQGFLSRSSFWRSASS